MKRKIFKCTNYFGTDVVLNNIAQRFLMIKMYVTPNKETKTSPIWSVSILGSNFSQTFLISFTFNHLQPLPPAKYILMLFRGEFFFFFFYLFSLHWPKESCLHLVYSEKWNFIQWRWRGCSPALENILLLFI